MNPHQIYGKMIISSGEDGDAFIYEPSYAHTSRSFNARMDKRIAEARKDQGALVFAQEEHSSNGSVNPLPAAIRMPMSEVLTRLTSPTKKVAAELPTPYSHYGD